MTDIVCVHRLFERRAADAPDALALVCGERHVTRRELNERANRCARLLGQRGVGVETLVGICMESSLDAVIGVLAIMKAGAAYVALPTTFPAPRLEAMIAAAGLRTVLATSAAAERIAGEGLDVVCVDEVADSIAALPSADLAAGPALDNAALVRFTSGSSGAPKGVVVTHRSLVAEHASTLLDMQHDDVCAINTTRGFGERLFRPLALGAPVVVLADDAVRDPHRLVRELRQTRVTSMFMVPSLLRSLLDVRPSDLESLGGMRAIVVGGEALAPDLIARFAAALPKVLLINAYGGTEIGTYAAMHVVNNSTADWRSIGKPLPGTAPYVLDEELGVIEGNGVGELYLSSPYLARGYLEDAGLTAERFVPDPFSVNPGQRMYRSGDLVSRGSDGEIIFVGRADQQVKVRGLRVEPGEVEAVLLGSGMVRQAIVVAGAFTPAQGATPPVPAETTRLVAYLVTDEPVSISALRAHLASRVPDYMIPAAFVLLDRLPMLPGGKVDRHALPPVSPDRPDLDVPFAPPRNPLEAVLCDAWASTLGLRGIGVHDRFLELGGDSLIAVALIARVQEQCGVEIPVAVLFEQSTVAALADYIATTLAAQPS